MQNTSTKRESLPFNRIAINPEGMIESLLARNDEQALLAWAERALSLSADALMLRSLDSEAVGKAASIIRNALTGVLLFVNTPKPQPIWPVDGLHLKSNQIAAVDCMFRWLSKSCHSLSDLLIAQGGAFNFVFLSPVFPTLSHPHAPFLGLNSFSDWVRQVEVPVFALGGVEFEDEPELRKAGAAGWASIRAFQ